METNKIDKNIQKKFENRTFKLSTSSWERLSVELDEQAKQKKVGWFFYIGAAASILLLVSIGIELFSGDIKDFTPKNEVVIDQIDRNLIDKKLEEFIKEISIQEALVNTNKVDDQVIIGDNKSVISKKKKPVVAKNEKPLKRILKRASKKEKVVIAKIEEKPNVISIKQELKIKESFDQKFNSSIKINSEDLLYAVTHTSREVKEYYAKYNVSRDDVLKTIRNELKESNLKVNPNTILAEVERTINDDVFQNNFMKSLKRRLTDIALVIATRNN